VPVLMLTTAFALFAPTIIGIIYGDAFVDASAPILRVLGLMMPISLIGVSFGTWLITQHKDRVCTIIVLTAGAFNVALGSVLTLSSGPIGMAWSVVAAEALAALGGLFVVTRDGRRRRVRVSPGSPDPDLVAPAEAPPPVGSSR
jgi:O-antigen/teichoic acid export membrane protein